MAYKKASKTPLSARKARAMRQAGKSSSKTGRRSAGLECAEGTSEMAASSLALTPGGALPVCLPVKGGKLLQDPALLEEARTLRLKRRFSQNFLVVPAYHQAIVNAALGCEPETSAQQASEGSVPEDALPAKPAAQKEVEQVSPADLTVLEIGAGAGFLTRMILPALLPTGKLIAVELERQMVRYLETHFEAAIASGQMALMGMDILKVDFAALPRPLTVIGNLPYAITGQILQKLCGPLQEKHYPIRQHVNAHVLLVQKEVGMRICAKPGTKAYNPLSIAIQFWHEARMICDVPPKAFYPAPKVTSSVVQIVPRKHPAFAFQDPERSLPLLDSLVRSAFAQRRKTLWNNLKSAALIQQQQLDEPTLLAVLASVEILPDVRGEQLTIEQFCRLTEALLPCLKASAG